MISKFLFPYIFTEISRLQESVGQYLRLSISNARHIEALESRVNQLEKMLKPIASDKPQEFPPWMLNAFDLNQDVNY